MQIEIDRLDHQGRGIGLLNDKIIFVNNALPGEIVEVNTYLEKKKFYEGTSTKIVKKSEHRIESKCPYFNECGGCDLLHLSYLKQLEFKYNKVIDILKKYSDISDIENKVKKIIPSDDIFNYRDKVTFQVKEEIGFYKRKSLDLIPINECLLVTDNMNNILKKIKNNLNLKNINQVIIKDMKNCQIMLTIYLQNNKEIEKIKEIFSNNVTSLNIFVQNKLVNTINKSNIIAKLSSFNFLVSSESFFQVNLNQTVKLYDKIVEYANLKPSDTLLDLYCGTGTIGIYMSKHCNKVLGIEINEEAIKNANENKKLNKISNIQFMNGDTKNLIKKINLKPNVIVVDPPRSGLDSKVITEILNIYPEKLIYVSCDPMTLARDLKALKEKYELIEVTPVDMFPNTAHIECVSVLHRKNIEK